MTAMAARDFLNRRVEDLLALGNRKLSVEFDDGVLETRARPTIFSSMLWYIHTQYPDTPLLKEHHMGNGLLTGDTHLKLLSKVVFGCRDHYRQNGVEVNMEHLSALAYQSVNHVFNFVRAHLGRYLTSVNALDMVKVMNHPPIKEFRKKMEDCKGYGTYNPDAFNELVKRELLHAPELANNAVAKLARTGLVSVNQIVQCVGSRGRPTDIDGIAFKSSILPGFAKGLSNVADSLMESRSASISLYLTKSPMQDSEYLNRAIQLSSASIKNLHRTNCGSTTYLHYHVSTSNDLRDMDGIYYLNEETQQEQVIRPHMKHLVNKSIKIRSVLTCQHPDRQGVCSHCFGELADSIPDFTVLGHVSGTELQSKISQLILSNKHYLASAILGMLQLSDLGKIYLRDGPLENHLYLCDWLMDKRNHTRIIISEEEARNLGDVATAEDISVLVPMRLSSLTHIRFEVDREGTAGAMMEKVDCRIGERNASLSRNMLAYMKTNGWELDNEGNYIIDLKDWDVNEPLVELPLKNFSTVDYMYTIENFIKGIASKGQQSLTEFESVSAALQAFHSLVSLKLEVHLSYLQVIVLGTMVESLEHRDYRTPMPRWAGRPARYQHLMLFRSMVSTMAYQEQSKALLTPASYLIKDRPEHPLDALIEG